MEPNTPDTIAEYNSAFSPDIPGLQIAWDSTSLGYLKTCPRLYYYRMIAGWVPKQTSHHLTFGAHMHSALEYYDHQRAKGASHDDALRATIRQTLLIAGERNEVGEFIPWESQDGKGLKTRETLVRTVLWYLDQFGKDDMAQTLVLANGKPAVELSFQFELGIEAPDGQPYLLCGHFDRVAKVGNDVWVIDRKTTGRTLSSYFFDQFSPNNQMSLYSTASRVVLGLHSAGVMIDGAQIAVGFSKFGRGFAHRNEAQCTEWLHDVKHWIKQAERYAEEEYWPMNDTACSHYGGCSFRDVCGRSPEYRGNTLRSKFTVQIWDPTEARGD